MYEHSEGATLKLRVTPWRKSSPHEEPSSSRAVHAEEQAALAAAEFEVVHAFTPFTMSAVYRVRPVGPRAGEVLDVLSSLPGAPPAPTEFVIKLYDRRHRNNERTEDNHPYSPAVEAKYQAHLAGSRTSTANSGDAQDDGSSVASSHEDTKSATSDSSDDWVPVPEYEATLAANAESDYAEETVIYGRLAEGFASGKRPAAPYYSGHFECESEIGAIKGILLESISPALRLTEYLESAGTCGHRTDEVARVADSVIEAAESIMQYDFTSYDIRTDTVILANEDASAESPLTTVPQYRPISIDFADCRLRYSDETALEWLTQQREEGDDSAIAYEIREVLKRTSKTACAEHGESCWATPRGESETREPAWTINRNPRYEELYTKDQLELLARISSWGRYGNGPHAPTLAEHYRARESRLEIAKASHAEPISAAAPAVVDATEKSLDHVVDRTIHDSEQRVNH